MWPHVIEEDGECGVLNGLFKIGVLTHDAGGLAPQLQSYWHNVLCCSLHDDFPHLCGPRECQLRPKAAAYYLTLPACARYGAAI